MAKAKIEISVSRELLVSFIEEEMSKYNWNGRIVEADGKMDPIAAISFILEKPMALAMSDRPLVQFFPDNVIDYIVDNPPVALLMGDGLFCKVLRFINNLTTKTGKTPEEVLKSFVKIMVAHEWRHTMQYDFLAEKGLNPAEVINYENNNYEYFDRPFEKDAYDFQKGKINDLNAVFAQHLNK